MTDQINNQPATPADNEQAFTEQWRKTWEANRTAKQYMRATESEIIRAHNAWLNTTYLYIRGARFELEKTNRSYNFSHCVFPDADFSGSEIVYADFIKADLSSANFTNAILDKTNFYGATLNNADFTNANLEGVDFDKAYLTETKGLKILCPVGEYGRLIYAYTRNGEIRIQAGCFNGDPDKLRAAIHEKYEAYWRSPGLMSDYLAAVDYLEQWGKLELQRLEQKQ